MALYEFPCLECDKLFITSVKDNYFCSQKCADSYRKRTDGFMKKKKSNKEKRTNQIDIIAKKAMEHGMSYGKYVAMTERKCKF